MSNYGCFCTEKSVLKWPFFVICPIRVKKQRNDVTIGVAKKDYNCYSAYKAVS